MNHKSKRKKLIICERDWNEFGSRLEIDEHGDVCLRVARGGKIYLRNLIVGAHNDTVVIHKNGNKLDCRRGNLEIVKKPSLFFPNQLLFDLGEFQVQGNALRAVVNIDVGLRAGPGGINWNGEGQWGEYRDEMPDDLI